MSVKYLYDEEKLAQLGENLYGATKRISTLHTKIYSKQKIAAGVDQFIFGKVENENYVEINLSEARNSGHQLHFVGYNYVVSSTSTSTKVRMTTDSSMRTESSLSLNGVTKPAPGVIPSLRGILLCSRCHLFYSSVL